MNNKQILALATGALLWMSSCTHSGDLDKLPGAAVRTQEAINETVTALEGHSGYWRLTYYPDSKRAYGGYSMYVQFKDGRVTALSELSTTSTNSTYAVRNIDMPTLAFDTRSNVLHHFSTSTEYFRNARGGDFELLLMGKSGDSILLQGRKYRNRMSLVPITTDPATEIAALQAMTQKFQGKGLAPVTIGTAGQVELRLHPTYRQLEFILAGEGTEQKKEQVAFAYTTEGLRFYEPITIGGVTISGFRLSSDGGSVTSLEGGLTTTLVSLPIDLVGKSYVAYLTTDYASSGLISYFTKVNKSLYSQRKARMSARTYFGVNTEADQKAGLVGNDTQVTSFITMPIFEQADGSYTRLSYEVDFVPVGSDPTQIDVLARDGNETTWWYWYAGSADYWISRLSSRAPYKVETLTDTAGDTYYKLTSAKDDKTWFYLYEVK
ncbi:DUF4302 domain-containing protein [uncultured Porphyromonas sp.]|uniref:DUF4302 domain-containing protein n=1 Tax=uncultured Porphyromonas sp. TaxID=159274 RepID=UPI002616C0AC|nr:DUF4302 domain-containing protein [uncultured Porphyromonas sp.]